MGTVDKNNLPQVIKDIPADEFQLLNTSTLKEREHIATPSLSFSQDLWYHLERNKAATISMSFLAVIIFISTTTIWVSPHNLAKQNVSYINLPPRVPGLESVNGLSDKTTATGQLTDKYAQTNIPDNVNFYLGADGLGRDVLSRLFMRTRVSLLVAFIATILDITVGATYELIFGLVGGRADIVAQRILKVLSGIPNLIAIILMLTVFDPGIVSIVLTMVITNWISMVRVVRAQTMKLKDQEFVMATETSDEPCWKIAIKHILPNISSVVIVQMMFSIPSAIFFETFLSLVGLGLRPPTVSLRTLSGEGYKTFRFLPYLAWIPVATLSVIMICFNLLAGGLRDAFDPKMKE